VHHSLLSNLSIGDLADVVGGRLRLGSLPPLGGCHEPVGRLQTHYERLAAGELFWGLSTAEGNGSQHAEAAYMRQAAGAVVEGRGLEPWAGRFSIEVENSRLALWQLAAHVRGQFAGPLIAMLGDRPPRQLETWFQNNSGLAADCCDGPQHVERSIRLPLGMLELQEESDVALLALPVKSLQELDVFLHLCDPEIVVITTNLLSQIWPVGQPHDKQTVLAEVGKLLPPKTWTIMLDAPGGSADLQALWEGELQFEMSFAERRADEVNQNEQNTAILAQGLGRILGVKQEHGRNQHRIAEASPFAFGLRESDATLPPGLERLAY
jgi:hypothetical protein